MTIFIKLSVTEFYMNVFEWDFSVQKRFGRFRTEKWVNFSKTDFSSQFFENRNGITLSSNILIYRGMIYASLQSVLTY